MKKSMANYLLVEAQVEARYAKKSALERLQDIAYAIEHKPEALLKDEQQLTNNVALFLCYKERYNAAIAKLQILEDIAVNGIEEE